jgi:hypothetical protein
MSETSTCCSSLCGVSVEGSVAACPRCGGRMRTPRDVRRVGWLLVFLGVFLVIFMGAIAWSLSPALLQPGQETLGGDTFTGTAAQARMIFTLFGATMLLGLGFAVNGAVQIATGRRNRVLTALVLGAAVALGIYALAASLALEG